MNRGGGRRPARQDDPPERAHPPLSRSKWFGAAMRRTSSRSSLPAWISAEGFTRPAFPRRNLSDGAELEDAEGPYKPIGPRCARPRAIRSVTGCLTGKHGHLRNRQVARLFALEDAIDVYEWVINLKAAERHPADAARPCRRGDRVSAPGAPTRAASSALKALFGGTVGKDTVSPGPGAR
jgi:hypothetical protein